jgi:drug/metabolite transporter (DMT)-like permease
VFLNIFGVILFVFENYYSVSYYHRVFVFFLFLLMNYIFFSQFFVQKIRYSFLQQEINQKYTFTWKQYFLAVLCIFVLGINVVALKYFTLSSDVFFVMGLKSFGAFLFFAFLLFVKKFKNRSAKLFPVFSLLFYLTSISYVLNILFFVLGISFSSPVHAVLIQGFSSVFLLALYNKNKYAIFEKSRNLLILIAIMTALAFFLLVGNSRAFFPDSNCVGDAFQVISALFFASFVFFFSRLKKQTENTVPYQLWFTGIAALSFFLSPLSFSFSLENFLLIVTGFTASGVINYIWYSVLQTSSNKMLVIFRVHFLVFVAIIIDFIFFQREATLPLVMAHFFMIATVLLTELLYLDSKNTVKVSLS